MYNVLADWRSVCEALEFCGWTNCRQCAVRRSLFFVRWDLRILIRNENGTKIRKNIA